MDYPDYLTQTLQMVAAGVEAAAKEKPKENKEKTRIEDFDYNPKWQWLYPSRDDK